MIAYRIAKIKWIDDLSGIGAKLAGGRWNPKGIPMLYCASTSSLAILEKLVRVDFDLLPDDLILVKLELPDNSILHIKSEDLPADWNLFPGPDRLKLIGKEWIEDKRSLILEVPSAVNPMESNYLINVHHSLISKVRIINSAPVTFDKRLLS